MKIESTTNSARLLLAVLSLSSILGSAHSVQADESKPVEPEPASLPRVFDGAAGLARLTGYAFTMGALFGGVLAVVQSSSASREAADLAAPLSRSLGTGACRSPLAANASTCESLVYTMVERDRSGDYAVGFFVAAGVMSAAATASIWLWRTPGPSFWLPDRFRASPTVGPKSGGVLLQGTW